MLVQIWLTLKANVSLVFLLRFYYACLLGAKTQWADGRLTINGALFYVEWENPQLASATVNASIPITVNAGGAESTGFELSGDWLATDRLRIRGSLSYTESELTADVPSLCLLYTSPSPRDS